jgi:hypothetical protein
MDRTSAITRRGVLHHQRVTLDSRLPRLRTRAGARIVVAPRWAVIPLASAGCGKRSITRVQTKKTLTPAMSTP